MAIANDTPPRTLVSVDLGSGAVMVPTVDTPRSYSGTYRVFVRPTPVLVDIADCTLATETDSGETFGGD